MAIEVLQLFVPEPIVELRIAIDGIVNYRQLQDGRKLRYALVVGDVSKCVISCRCDVI